MKTETVGPARYYEAVSLEKWAKNRKKHLHYRVAAVKFNNYEVAGRLLILGGNSGAQGNLGANQCSTNGEG
jgi:hypothetical protein